jgi:hypothetical protein
LVKFVIPLKWCERIKSSFGSDPLSCPKCGRTMELAKIWEPKGRFVWMKRWLETHRMRKAALKELGRVQNLPKYISPRRYHQLSFGFANTS